MVAANVRGVVPATFSVPRYGNSIVPLSLTSTTIRCALAVGVTSELVTRPGVPNSETPTSKMSIVSVSPARMISVRCGALDAAIASSCNCGRRFTGAGASAVRASRSTSW